MSQEPPDRPRFSPAIDPVTFTYKYQWVTRGENCPVCDALAGQVHTFSVWVSAGLLPGFHLNCNCSLKKVAIETPASDRDFFGDLYLWTDQWARFNWFSDSFTPYNWLFTQEIARFSRPGEPISQAFKRMRAENRDGFFFRDPHYGDFFQWRVFKTFRHFRDRNHDVHSINHRPRPRQHRAPTPWLSHKSYDIRSYRPGYRTATIANLRTKHNPRPGTGR